MRSNWYKKKIKPLWVHAGAWVDAQQARNRADSLSAVFTKQQRFYC